MPNRPRRWPARPDRGGAGICPPDTTKAGKRIRSDVFSLAPCVRLNPPWCFEAPAGGAAHAIARTPPHLLASPRASFALGAADDGIHCVPRIRALCSLGSPVVRATPAPLPCLSSRLLSTFRSSHSFHSPTRTKWEHRAAFQGPGRKIFREFGSATREKSASRKPPEDAAARNTAMSGSRLNEWID